VTAIQRNPRGDFVYVVKPDNTVEVRKVTIGATQGDVAALDSGVTAGELLVTDGLDKLAAGSKVSVQVATNAMAQKSSQ
jgi:multidrug efflux system membrane fusion protein